MPNSSSGLATTTENSLGLTSTTWSFGSNKEAGNPNAMKDGGWGTMPPSSSSSNLTPMGQDLWGLSRTAAGAKPAVSGWPTSNGWSNGTNMPPGGGGSAWLLLKNLTAQIDGSTLRTLCMQHGPLNNFHLYLTHGIALAKYSNGSEAKKVSVFVFLFFDNCKFFSGKIEIIIFSWQAFFIKTIFNFLSFTYRFFSP